MTKKIFSNQYLLLFFRIVLSFVFIYSGYIKIIDASGFSDSISNYKLLPDFSINFLAITLPWIELIPGLLLLFGISIKENAFLINFLLLIFIIAVAISLIKGLDIDCGCFGTSGGTKVGVTKLIENSIMVVMGILLMIFNSELFLLKKD